MNTCLRNPDARHGERGVTIFFVVVAMVAILAIAALSSIPAAMAPSPVIHAKPEPTMEAGGDENGATR